MNSEVEYECNGDDRMKYWRVGMVKPENQRAGYKLG